MSCIKQPIPPALRQRGIKTVGDNLAVDEVLAAAPIGRLLVQLYGLELAARLAGKKRNQKG